MPLQFPSFNNRVTPFDPNQLNELNLGLDQPPTDINQFKPVHNVLDQMTSMMSNIPQRRDNQGILQRILAGIVGAGSGGGPAAISNGSPIGFRFDASQGMPAADRFMNHKYYNDMDTFDNKLKMLSPMLQDERNQNTQNRIMYDASEQRRISQGQLDRQTARDAQLGKSEDAKNELAKQKQAADEHYKNLLAAKEAYDLKVTDSGEIVGINKSNPKDVVSTGTKANVLTAEQQAALGLKKLEIQQSNALDRIAAQGANQMNRLTAPKPEAPSASKTRAQLIANNVKLEHPMWAPYITIDASGQVVVDNKLATKDAKMYNDIVNALKNSSGIQMGQGSVVPENNNKIDVIRLSDGQDGIISARYFDPKIYKKVVK